MQLQRLQHRSPSEVDPFPIASTSAPHAQERQPQSPRLPIEKLIAQVGRESRQRHEENRRAAQLSARVMNNGEALNVTASAAAAAAGSLLSQLGAARQASNPPAASNTTATTAAAAPVNSQPAVVPDTTNATPADISTPATTATPPATTTPATTVTPAAAATPVSTQFAAIHDAIAIPALVTTSIPAADALPADTVSTLFNVDSVLGKRTRDGYDLNDDDLEHIKQLKRNPLDTAPVPAPVTASLSAAAASAPVASAPAVPHTTISVPNTAPADTPSTFYTTESTLGKRSRDDVAQYGSEEQIDRAKRAKLDGFSKGTRHEGTALTSAKVAPPATSQRMVRGSDFLDVDSLPVADDLPAVTADVVHPIADLLGPAGPMTSEGKHVSILHKLDPDQGTMRGKYQEGLRRKLVSLYEKESASPAELEHLLMVDDEFDDHMSTYRQKRKVILELISDYFRDRYDAQHDEDDIYRRTTATWRSRLQGSIVENMKKVPIKISDFRGIDQLANCHLGQYYKHLAWEAELSMDKRESGDRRQPLWLAHQLRAAMAAAMAKQLKWLDFAYHQVAKQWQERKRARAQAAGMVPAQAQAPKANANAHGQLQPSIPAQGAQANSAVFQQLAESALPDFTYTQTPLLDPAPVVFNVDHGTYARTSLRHGVGHAQSRALMSVPRAQQDPGRAIPYDQRGVSQGLASANPQLQSSRGPATSVAPDFLWQQHMVGLGQISGNRPGSTVSRNLHGQPESAAGYSMPGIGPMSGMKAGAVPQHSTAGLWQPGLRPHSPSGRRLGRIERELSQSPRPSAPAPIFDLTGEDEEDFDVSRVNIDNVDETPRKPQVQTAHPASPPKRTVSASATSPQRVAPEVPFTPHAMAAFAQSVGQIQRDLNPVEQRMHGRGQQRSRHESQAQDDILRRAASRAAGNDGQNRVQKRSRGQKKATKSLAEPSSSTASGAARHSPQVQPGHSLLQAGHMQPPQQRMGPGGAQDQLPPPNSSGAPPHGPMVGQNMPQQFAPLQPGAQMLPCPQLRGRTPSAHGQLPQNSPQMSQIHARQVPPFPQTPTPMPSVPAGPNVHYSPAQASPYLQGRQQMVPKLPANIGNTQGGHQMFPSVPANVRNAQAGQNHTAPSGNMLPQSMMHHQQGMPSSGGVPQTIGQGYPSSNVQTQPAATMPSDRQQADAELQRQIAALQARHAAQWGTPVQVQQAPQQQVQQQVQPQLQPQLQYPIQHQYQHHVQNQSQSHGQSQAQYQAGNQDQQQLWQQNPQQVGYQGQPIQPQIQQQTPEYGPQLLYQGRHQIQPQGQQLTAQHPPQTAPPKRRRPAKLGAARNNLEGRVQAQRIEPATVPPYVEQPVTNPAPVIYESMNAEVAAALGRTAPEQQRNMPQYPPGSPRMH